ncbi:MAG: NAD(P)/FAD-dependent oxidoreductase [Flavobacteriaceae bacterium]|nr:NAD(P)/FAD-dependent oxidoreductase [Flavobacteriaceae bacterium]
MTTEVSLKVSPEEANNPDILKKIISEQSDIERSSIDDIEILKRSIDARQRDIKFNLKVLVYINETKPEQPDYMPDYPYVGNKQEVIVIGAGPAGLFAALKLVEEGYKPIVLERGKDVKSRRRDLAAITKFHIVDEDSNYCFGEGGAGTYSDGKLYTRSKKRGDVNKILDLFVAHGATNNIRVDAHPHIGTNKLPKIIQNIRETIVKHGGEVLFEARVTDILVKNNKVEGVELKDKTIIKASKIILATGHSARDIFELLYSKNIKLEAKPFALGVRVEHSQNLIDKIQYKCDSRGEYLPPAPYSIVKQVEGRGVYSFCMCPGGVIAPCSTAPGEVVTNGWSPSKRDQPTSNSGIVVALNPEDFAQYSEKGPLAALEFQKQIEQRAWRLAGESQRVPAQRLADFTKGVLSTDIPKTSYNPGTTSVEMGDVLPEFIHKTLQKGFIEFGKSMKGYMTNDAVVHAPESRTSSPVKIPRDRVSLEHVEVEGLYPCGEGAGYAGGIISAAIDGEKCAEKCALSIKG